MITPLETKDPELGQLLQRVAQFNAGWLTDKTSPRIKIESSRITYIPRSGQRKTMDETGPNDPCPCGSGRKFKKCCRR